MRVVGDEVELTNPSTEVIRVLKQRAPTLGPCPVCLTNSGYTVEDGIVHFPLTQAGTLTIWNKPGTFLACGVATCNNCGYTLFLNLFRLGLGHLTGLARAGDPELEDRE